MSHLIYLESTCDKCAAQTRDRYTPQEAPLPRGWVSLRLGAAPSRHLCEQCHVSLLSWLGPAAP
jgi:hypothetical protein